MTTPEDLIAASDAGTLLETIAATSREQFESVGPMLADLHNRGDIDFLAAFEPSSLADVSARSIRSLQSNFRQVLPLIDCRAEAAEAACRNMFERLAGDGAADQVYESLSQWFRRDPGRAEEGLALIERDPTTHRRLVRPVLLAGAIHDADRYVQVAFRLSNDPRSPVRLDALWSLGRVVPADNEPLITRTLERFNEVIDAPDSDEDTAIVVEATLDLLCRTDGRIVDAVESLLEKASGSQTPSSRYTLATGLLDHRCHYSEAMIDATLAALQHTTRHETHTAKSIDWILYQWDLDADRRRVFAFLVELFNQGQDALDFETLSDFRHQLRDQPGHVLGWYVVSLLLTGEHALCTAAERLLPFNETREGFDIDLSPFSLSPRWVLYLARKILGYGILNMDGAAALLLSCLRAMPEPDRVELEELVLAHFLMNYWNAIDWFEATISDGDRAKQSVDQLSSRLREYVTELERHGFCPAFQPSERERQLQGYRQADFWRAVHKKAEQGSLLFRPGPQDPRTLRSISHRLRSQRRCHRAGSTGGFNARHWAFVRPPPARNHRSGRLSVQHPDVPGGASALMKLLFTQYLASLKERDELDVILPDLLCEIGLNVLSRPARGTRQHGVDVAAVGTLPGDVRSLYLIAIKPGDLRKKRGWDNGEQALRPSLNEILDVYIPRPGGRGQLPTRGSHDPGVPHSGTGVLARLRAQAMPGSTGEAGVLILDNPLGKANKALLLKTQIGLADAMGVQQLPLRRMCCNFQK